MSLSLQSRMKLLRELKGRGAYVRWHAFEFLLGWRDRIAGVLLLEPLRKRCTLYCWYYCEELRSIVEESLRGAGLDAEVTLKRTADH